MGRREIRRGDVGINMSSVDYEIDAKECKDRKVT